MTGDELRDARRTLGERIGLDRPLYGSELGRALGLKGRDPGEAVHEWERHKGPTGPAAAAVRAWLRETDRGGIPPELSAASKAK